MSCASCLQQGLIRENDDNKGDTLKMTAVATIAEALALAVKHHQAGDLGYAEEVYRRVLQADPANAEACCHLGNACLATNRYDEAIGHYRQALALRPDYPDADQNLAQALRRRQHGNTAPSPTSAGEDAKEWNRRGIALARQERFAEAAAHFEQALRLRPDFADAHSNLGNTLYAQGHYNRAIACFQEALRLVPDLASAHSNLGNVCKLQGKPDEAVVHYQKAISLNPALAEAHNNLGTSFMEQKKYAEAADCYRRVVQLQPDHADAHNSLGNALRLLDRIEEAADCYRQTLRCQPDHIAAHYYLALMLQGRRDLEGALAGYRQILRIEPDHVEAHCNMATIWLLQGDFERGWPGYEWRWRLPSMRRKAPSGPTWDGTSRPGGTLLLEAEQGAGDAFQFIRFAPLVARQGTRVLVECLETLVDVLASCPGVDQVFPAGAARAYDAYVPLMSLPRFLRTTVASIPADVPYLRAGAELVRRWRQRIGRAPGLRVGMVWQCKNLMPEDPARSVPLPIAAGLGAVPGVSLFSLQKGPGTERLEFAPCPITDLGSAFDTYADTAAAIANLDLVVSVDTSVAHLAGALGVPVWVALPFASDWRWLLRREDSPWYPGMRLFRQSEPGNWSEVFERITHELNQLLATGVNLRE